MNQDNYIHIQGWMVSNLNLRGNELIAFAMIHGFSQDGKSEFVGSIKYVSEWLNCSRPTAIKTIRDLEERNLIVKTSSDNQTGKYKVNVTSSGTFIDSSKETLPVKKLYPPSKETLHNTNINTNKDIYTPAGTVREEYTTKDFIKRWGDARKHYDKKPTHIERLNTTQKSIFNELTKYYTSKQFDIAINGLFSQKTYPQTRVNPTHFLENFEQYLTCGETGEKLFETKTKKKDNTGML